MLITILFLTISAGELSDEVVNRAKNQLKASLFMNLELRNIHLDDIGRQVVFAFH